jgi:hypothetical protein
MYKFYLKDTVKVISESYLFEEGLLWKVSNIFPDRMYGEKLELSCINSNYGNIIVKSYDVIPVY